jgi:hypothetical protein
MNGLTTSIWDENERGDKSSGAGAAPGRQNLQPRARSERGKQGSGNEEFFRFLSRMLLSNGQPRSVTGSNPDKAGTLGEFRGQARWISAAYVTAEHNRVAGAGDASTDGEDKELGTILTAIAEDVQRFSAAACAGIMAEFSGRMQHARRFLPPRQVAGALQALKEARSAALATIKRNAAADLAARREAAVRMHGSKIRAVRKEHRRARRRPSGPKPE